MTIEVDVSPKQVDFVMQMLRSLKKGIVHRVSVIEDQPMKISLAIDELRSRKGESFTSIDDLKKDLYL